jgi:hypothetical protein
MESTRTRNPQTALMSLEAAAAAARGGFACMFSDSDEYETALIAERRAQGRYGQSNSRWPMVLLVGAMLVVFVTGLMFG